jgi:dihydrofolate reductase
VENVAPGELAELLRKDKGSDIWLMGGAEVFSEFLNANVIDQIVIHVVPVLIGTGIQLLDTTPRQAELTLRSTRRFSDGVVRLHYDVQGRVSDLTETDEDAARATATG